MEKKELMGIFIIVIPSLFHIYTVEVLNEFMITSWIIAVLCYILGIMICTKQDKNHL